ncbi:hypothetical protein [Sphingomonas sp. GM_Shp_2]|uniref:hypothetical protein n=1 Tax=Sphingomonas sp. GM_Shp_2 TaxID=2937380 RepID=UPI002269CE36|nr:hypothetical protein [Sphingomonas sp. GM_Shp_2]
MKIHDASDWPAPAGIHSMDCTCWRCRPYPAQIDPRLDSTTLGKLTVAGFLCATVIACIIDPPGMAGLLRDMVGL